MNNLIRLVVLAVAAAGAVLILALGLARHDSDIMAPLHLLLFVALLVIYLLPTGLAVYRDCKATLWIALLDVFLGWTIVGWFAALGWAVSGSVKPFTTAPPPTGAVHVH